MGWILLCHQTIPQPCHYCAVKAVSGCVVAVSNASEVTICGTWYDRGCRRPSQVNSFLTESWRAECGSLFDNSSSQNNTCRGDCICPIQRDFTCVEHHAIYDGVLWKSVLISLLMISTIMHNWCPMGNLKMCFQWWLSGLVMINFNFNPHLNQAQ